MINPHTLPKIEEIELWRKANGMTREQIASLLEVSHSMYEKWCSPKSNRVIPPYKQAEMKDHMSPPKRDIPDRISIGASWEEVQAWSKAFKQSPDADLQSWMLNELNKLDQNAPQAAAITHEALETAILLLAPIAPHLCHYAWAALGHGEAIIDATWPSVDEAALVRSSLTMAVQVNGKVRSQIEVAVDAKQEDIEQQAIEDTNVQRFTEGKSIRKVIVVPSRLVNIVVA